MKVRMRKTKLVRRAGPAGREVVDVETLPRPVLERMAAAAREIERHQRVLAKTGHNVVGELLRGFGTFTEWEHYPPDDVFDPATQSQFYYHAHPPEDRNIKEHGHFHLFMRRKGMPPGVTPAPLPDLAPATDENAALCHLVGISMDSYGSAIRLFTVNRWVTGETWYEGADVIRMLDDFALDVLHPNWLVNCWVTELVRLFRPQVEYLIAARDRTIAAWQAERRTANVFEDRRLAITSILDISVERQIAAVDRALTAR